MGMIKEGMVIEGPFWPEPVEIKKVDVFGDRVHIIGATIYSNTHIDQLILRAEIEKLKAKEFILDFSAPGSETFLSIEAERYRFASLFDPLLAMNTSKIDPLPFQIEAVYGYILKLPRIRFLIADDPGAGKTIMAGLILKELKLRGVVNRILIVVPGHLKDQWRREMKEKFQEPFTMIDRGLLDAHYAENVWRRESQVITSMDFAKGKEILPALGSVEWDLVIVDEAHKMAAYMYGNKLSRTERYKLGKALSDNSDHLLFLTATPHKGDPENFRLFLDLLVRGFFATQKLIDASLENRDNPLFIRRLKEDLKDFEGKPIFTNRYPETIKFRLSDKEQVLYNKLSKYVISQYNVALQSDKRRNVAFALLILQRRMASSTYALLRSLERRKEKLEGLLKGEELVKEMPMTAIDLEEVEDYEEEKRWEHEKRWETLSIAENRAELEKEIFTLSDLIEKAKAILREECEVKLSELKKAIEEGFRKIREIHGNEKILIFTESKDTLEYLVKRIKSWGYAANFIHGGMRLEERINAEKIFQHETQVMIATEAAGEGINLQFCHLMINYDIPWNPNRLEQRMGRVHRYGQQKDVYVFNLVADSTREGKVLAKLFDKLEEIRKAVGSDKVFDVIGDTFYGKNLYQLVLDAVANARSMDDIIKELDIKVDENYIKEIKEALGESLATRHIDYTRIKEMADKAKEYRLIPEYVEEFFKRAFRQADGKFRIRKDGFMVIDSIPYEIRKIAEEVDFKNRYGSILRQYPKATFDKELAFKNPDAEFISFGHPLFEGLLEWVKRNYFANLQKGAMFKDPAGRYNGILWFFEGEVKDGKGDVAGKRLMAIFQELGVRDQELGIRDQELGINGKNQSLYEVNPAILWDFVHLDNNDSVRADINKEKVQGYAIGAVESYKQDIVEERNRQAEIKRKYGVKSLDFLIGELDAELAELYERQEEGDRVELAIRNKEERKRQYEAYLKTLQLEIEQEVSLAISMPKFIGAVLVKPEYSEKVGSKEMKEIGREFVKEYEREHGREPTDVPDGYGYDLISKGTNEVRYIEIKGFSREGEADITPNEWFKAKRFKEQFWLYVVANAATSPTLYIINNPAEKLNVEEKIEVVRFMVPIEEWKAKGVKA
jgi:SNF2 family DNA or RNA helicase